ncbi:MAG: ABC transporter substrate-binding protein, partial [Dehalococcoidia bacterium]
MASNWFRKPSAIASIPLVLFLLFFVACGSAAQPDPVAEPQSVSGADKPVDTQAKQPAAPTAAPQAAESMKEEMMAESKGGPSFASYWKPPTSFYGEPVYGGTLRINYEDPLEHANMWGARSGTTMRYRMPTTDSLIMNDPYNVENPDLTIPGLAHSWAIDDDRKGVTFSLREGVKWHNGTDFTCEDARFSFETMITEKGITAAYMKPRLRDVDLAQLECTDDFTLKFRFTKPAALPLIAFQNNAARPFNKEWFLAGGEEAMFQDVSVGTGPFVWAKGQETGVDEQHFEKNPNYYLEE